MKCILLFVSFFIKEVPMCPYLNPQVVFSIRGQIYLDNRIQHGLQVSRTLLIQIISLKYPHFLQMDPNKYWASYGSADLQLETSTEKTKFNQQIYQSMLKRKNVSYSTNTLFYKDLFLTIINCYNQNFVKSAIFQRKVLVSERLFVLQNKIYQ